MVEPAIVLEKGTAPDVAVELQRRGHRIVETESTFDPASTPFGSQLNFGGAQMIYKLDHGYIAASDPRRDGQAVGF